MAPTTIDLAGQQIGRLTILSYLGCAKWECLCSCGNKSIARTQALTKVNPTQSCGCLQREVASKAMKDRSGKPKIDLSNQRFEKLTVLGFAGVDPKSLGLSRHRLLWNCVCDCGKRIALRGYALTRTNRPTRSCGCLHGQPGRRRQNIGMRKFKVAVKVFPKAQPLKPKPPESILLSDSQSHHVQAEYNRILSIADSDLPFWADVDIFPKWRNYDEFRDWIEDELPPLIIGSRLTRISRYAGFIPGNIRWSDPVQKVR